MTRKGRIPTYTAEEVDRLAGVGLEAVRLGAGERLELCGA